MNSRKKSQLIALSMAFLITLSGALWVSRRGPVEDVQWASALALQASEVESLAIRSGHQPPSFPPVDLQREGGGWSVTQGQSVPGGLVEGLVTRLCNMEVGPAMGADPSAEYGLGLPTYWIDLTRSGGATTSIRIGDTAPGEAHDYVYLDGQVHLSRTRIGTTVEQVVDGTPIPDGSP